MVRRVCIGALALLATSGVFAQTWTQVWADEFSTGLFPDSTKWRYETGAGGWGNNELQNYTSRVQNARIDTSQGGRLLIEARRENFQGSQYTSARLKSADAWTYARVEFRAKVPRGRGTWPALWMLPRSTIYGTQYWPDNGEIDTMEHVGHDPNRVHGSVHTKGFNHMIGNPPTNGVVLSDVFDTWRNYVTEWRPHQILTSVDGFPILVWNREGGDWQRWPFNRPFELRMNIAVGGNWGGQQGVDPAAFPAIMQLDHVRISKLQSTPFGGTPARLPGRVEAENFDDGGNGFAYYDQDVQNQAGGSWRNQSVDVGGVIPDGTRAVGWIGRDEWLTYTVRVAREVKGTLAFRVGSIYGDRSFEVQLNDTPIGNVTVPNTGSWDAYRTVELPNVTLPAGTHQIRVIANRESWNFNWFEFKVVKGPITPGTVDAKRNPIP